MAINHTSDKSTTAASNVDRLGLNQAAGAGSKPVNTIDNLLRNGDAIDKQGYDDFGGNLIIGGSANAITATGVLAPSALRSYQRISIFPAADNTGATTLNWNSLGAKAVRKISGGTDVALEAGDLLEGKFAELVYLSTAASGSGGWILINPPAVTTVNNDNWSGTDLAVANGGTGASTAEDARTNLELVPGTNVQEQNANLQSLADITLVAGDILYATAADTLVRLAKGADGQVLSLSSGVPTWASFYQGYEYIGEWQHSTSGDTLTIEFTDLSPYRHLLLINDGNLSLSGNDRLIVRVSSDNGSSFASTGYVGAYSDDGGSAGYNNGFRFVRVSNDGNSAIRITLDNFNQTKKTVAHGDVATGGSIMNHGMGRFDTAVANDAIQITTDGGTDNFDGGGLQLFGMRG